jgi:hypothetical protein
MIDKQNEEYKEAQMVKYLTKYTNTKEFFSHLEENEVFMYSYLDFIWDDIVKLAEENKVNIEYIVKGTDEYKKYGECTAKVIKFKGMVYEFQIDSKETIKIEARTEESAREKLVKYLFNSNIIILNKVS